MAKIIKKSDPNSAHQAAQLLKNGGVAILPTDTVYGFSGIVGLQADASGGPSVSTPAHKVSTPEGVPTDEKIRHIKGRDENKPLIQLIATPQDVKLYTDAEIPDTLLSKWPGPLTIIVPIKADAPYPHPAHFPTVAFRCPGDPWLRSLIAEVGAPIFSTSVNRSGSPVLDEIAKIKEEFGQEVDLIVDDGDKKDGIPSTLVSILDGSVKVLRQGVLTI